MQLHLSLLAVVTIFLTDTEGFLEIPTTVNCRCGVDRPNDRAHVRLSSSKETSYSTDTCVFNYNKRRFTKNVLKQSGGILYRQSIFSHEELEVIRRDLTPIKKRLNEERSSVARKRLGASLPSDGAIVDLLKTGSMARYVKRLVGQDFELSSNLPVEVRTYEKSGAGMAWHVDDVLYDPPQVEAVITLENSCDCVTMWEAYHDAESKQTDPNSVLLIQSGGPSHCVTPLKRGKRTILKCAYAAADAVFREGVHNNQFETPSSSLKRKQKRKETKTERREMRCPAITR